MKPICMFGTEQPEPNFLFDTTFQGEKIRLFQGKTSFIYASPKAGKSLVLSLLFYHIPSKWSENPESGLFYIDSDMNGQSLMAYWAVTVAKWKAEDRAMAFDSVQDFIQQGFSFKLSKDDVVIVDSVAAEMQQQTIEKIGQTVLNLKKLFAPARVIFLSHTNKGRLSENFTNQFGANSDKKPAFFGGATVQAHTDSVYYLEPFLHERWSERGTGLLTCEVNRVGVASSYHISFSMKGREFSKFPPDIKIKELKD